MTPAALVLYFDGSCPLCVDQMQRLRGWDAHRRLGFVDIAAAGFDPAPLGMELAAMNREMHSRTADGRVLVGIDCMLAAYTLVGRGWRVWPLRVPGLSGVFAGLYRMLARHRHAVSRRLGYRLPPACDSGGCALHGNPFLKNEAPAGEASGMAPAAADRGPRRSKRDWIVTWMYAAAIAHLLVGALLPWLAGSSLLDGYQQGIEAHFWPGAAPAETRLQQQWWLALFGATVQCAGVWMLALVHLGNRLRQRAAWGWLLAGLLLWAPQDMLISRQARVGSHLVADAAALLLMVPPLLWLWKEDHA